MSTSHYQVRTWTSLSWWTCHFLTLCMKHPFSLVSMNMYGHGIFGLRHHSRSPGLFLCSWPVGISSIEAHVDYDSRKTDSVPAAEQLQGHLTSKHCPGRSIEWVRLSLMGWHSAKSVPFSGKVVTFLIKVHWVRVRVRVMRIVSCRKQPSVRPSYFILACL